MAEEFNEIWNKKRNDGQVKDVRKFPRPMAKLRIQANKVKHVLSANSDIPVFIDALHDDVNYQSHISRAKFEEVCHDLLLRAAEPIDKALKMANVTLEELNAVEMIGGAMRVPKVQEAVSAALGDMTLGMHLNSDESMALGAAFHGANVSTSFKVRHVGLADVNSFPVAVDLADLDTGKEAKKSGGGLFGIGKKKDDDKKKKKDDAVWAKHATIFKLGSKLGAKKTIAFSYEKDVHVEVNYEESETLPIGTGLSIEQFDVTGVAVFAAEMKKKELGIPKVSLQFELDTSGLVSLIKAEAVVEETIMVEEEVEIEDDEEDAKTEDTKADETKSDEDAKADEEEKKEGDDADAEKKDDAKNDDKKAEEKKEPKKKKTMMVQKEKKKKHVRALKVNSYNVGTIRPYSPDILAESQAKLAQLAQADKERMMLEESKNTYESYIYFIRNKLIDDEEEIAKVTSEEQREALRKSAEDAEEWMFDEGYTADLKTYDEKYVELSAPAEKAFFRMAELTARPKAIDALTAKLTKIEELMKKWETSMEHITEEERKEVLDKVAEVRKWVEDKVGEQEKTDATTDPVFTSEEVPGQTKRIESIVQRLMKKPKPKPVVVEKNDTEKTSEGNETETTEKSEGDSESSTEEKSDGEDKADEDSSEKNEAEEEKTDGDSEKTEGDEL